MAARRTAGEQMLPGDPENLLRVSRDRVRRDADVSRYLAVSVTTDEKGNQLVRLIRMDPSTRRVIPELLDEAPAELGCDPFMLIANWSVKLSLDARTDRV